MSIATEYQKLFNKTRYYASSWKPQDEYDDGSNPTAYINVDGKLIINGSIIDPEDIESFITWLREITE